MTDEEMLDVIEEAYQKGAIDGYNKAGENRRFLK